MAKIVIIGTAYPYRGGIAVFNERLASAIKEAGHDISIETFTLQYPNFLFPGKTQFAEWPYKGNVQIKRSINSINPLNWVKIGNQIRRQNYDLVIFRFWLPFMGPCFGTIARCIRKNKKTKIIAILDNVIPHEKRIGDTLFTKWFLKPIQGFITMSESVQSELAKFNESKPRLLCPHPLYDNFGEKTKRAEALQQLNLSPDYKYVLFFGLIRDYKGLDILIDAFSDSRLKELSVKLIVAGEFYGDSEKYFSQIDQLGLQDQIFVFPNFIPDTEVNRFFEVADIVAQPYKSATQSGVTQIAYHFEKPMVVTNVGGLGEIVPHGKVGYVVEVHPKAVANALIDFFSNKKPDCFIEGIREEKKKYSWERMVGTIQQLSGLLK
jgi:glycosyltransferase involved in cell wall biosynthesis